MSLMPSSSSGRAFTDSGPFTIIPEWVLDAPISSTAVRLYGVLGRYSDDAGKCWPSRKTLAGRLKAKSPRTVDSALGELKELGAVELVPRTDPHTGQTTNLYFIRRVQRTAHPLAESCEGGGVINCEGGVAEFCAQNESQLELEPDERDPALGAGANDALTLRLVRICKGPRVKVWTEAPRVLSLLREHYADHVIDQGVGICEALAEAPTLPRYLIKVVQDNANTGQHVPDLFDAFKDEGDAA